MDSMTSDIPLCLWASVKNLRPRTVFDIIQEHVTIIKFHSVPSINGFFVKGLCVPCITFIPRKLKFLLVSEI